VKRLSIALAIGTAAALLAGCGGGSSNSGATPPINQPTLANDKLQVAVGTVFNAADGTTGLNVVATFRQTGGGSAVLADTPSITGPAGFAVPAGFPSAYASASIDAGTHSITASPQVNVVTTPTNTTLGTFTGVFSYGLAPLNSDQVNLGYYPGNANATPGNGYGSDAIYLGGLYGGMPAAWWSMPLGAAAASSQGTYLMGPPAVPFFNDGTFPGGFAGYSPGFTAFDVPPATGTYTMNVTVTTGNGPSPSFSATSNNLTSVAPLPAPVVGALAENGGGLTGPITTSGTETLVFIEDTTSGLFYTVGPLTASGTFTLPPSLGPCSGTNCENAAATQKPSLVTGDTYVVTPISFDYPAFEDAPPGNTSQTPPLTGAAGQADISIGVPVSGTY